jgi:perosamine synthetase
MNKELLIDKLLVQASATVRDAMQIINRGELGMCFALQEHRLVGVLTDGDMRRALLNGTTLSDTVDSVMVHDFFSLPLNAPLDLIQKNLAVYKCIPIVNDQGELVDLATAQRYHQIPLVQPELDGNELEYVTDCILSGWISSQGKYVRQFEENFGDYVGCKNTLAVSNGTVALHLALVALGIGPGDEVIVPDLTFAASVNAVLYTGATPVLVDVDPKTMAIDPELVVMALTKRTRAIMPVHLYGYPADMTRLMALARQHKLLVIEDCAEALGSRYQGAHVGTFGDVATFSFYGNKTITTGEGGMLIFRDPIVRSRAKTLRDHGMSPERRYWHDEVGFNYRLTNIQAAVGVAQLEKVTSFVNRKRWIAAQYDKHLAGIAELQLPTKQRGDQDQNSYWLYTVVLMPKFVRRRDEILDLLKSLGIEARPVFFPMHRMPPYVKYALAGESYSRANHLSDGGISLPSSVSVTENEIRRVCSVLRKAFEEVRPSER